MNISNKQLNIIDGQLIGSILYIVSFIISISVIINQREIAKGNKGFLTVEESQALTLINKYLILALLVLFLYLNYKTKELAKQENQETKFLDLQIIASLISFIPALIGLYVVSKDFTNTSFQVAEIENPFA